MFDTKSSARARTLKHENVSTEQVPSQTVTNMARVDMFAIQYGDASGKAHNTIAFRIGGLWYMDEKDGRGERWAKELLRPAGWLSKQLDDMFESKNAPMPENLDPVGVLGDE